MGVLEVCITELVVQNMLGRLSLILNRPQFKTERQMLGNPACPTY